MLLEANVNLAETVAIDGIQILADEIHDDSSCPGGRMGLCPANKPFDHLGSWLAVVGNEAPARGHDTVPQMHSRTVS